MSGFIVVTNPTFCFNVEKGLTLHLCLPDLITLCLHLLIIWGGIGFSYNIAGYELSTRGTAWFSKISSQLGTLTQISRQNFTADSLIHRN